MKIKKYRTEKDSEEEPHVPSMLTSSKDKRKPTCLMVAVKKRDEQIMISSEDNGTEDGETHSASEEWRRNMCVSPGL